MTQKYVNGELVEISTEELEEHMLSIPEEVVFLPKKLYKSTLIRRMTVEEASQLKEILDNENAWLQMVYNATEWFDMADALASYMHMIISETVGEERANELLTPEF